MRQGVFAGCLAAIACFSAGGFAWAQSGQSSANAEPSNGPLNTAGSFGTFAPGAAVPPVTPSSPGARVTGVSTVPNTMSKTLTPPATATALGATKPAPLPATTTTPNAASSDASGDSGGATGAGDDADGYGFGSGAGTGPIATIKAHAFTLAECLALADRNHPLIWAARARLSYVHAQLDEAKWTPFWNWSASSNLAVLPPIVGSVVYTSTPASVLGSSFFSQRLEPTFSFDIGGAIPLYTFGKISSAREAAEANVRVSEWDMEKVRQTTRMDVRRAYYGLMLARDAKYIIEDVTGQLQRAIDGISARLAKDDKTVEETDRIRLETYRDELHARAGDATKGERFGIAALRFMTGVQTAFDIPDEPLKRPENELGTVTRYLSAARLFRPEVNQARAGVAAREHWVDFMRAQYFPDIGLGLGASYAVAPSVTPGANALTLTGSNHFVAPVAGIGVRWNLDLLPKSARVAEAESQLEETRALERYALGGIAVEVENAYGVAVETTGREAAWDAAEHRSRRWISMIQDGIDLGTKDERALTEPLRAYVNARVNHVYALMDMNLAFSDLARVTGVDDVAPQS